MTAGNLSVGCAKIKNALKNLMIRWEETGEVWRDRVADRFEETHLVPLDPQVQRAIQGIEELMQILQQAERECSEEAARL